MLNQLFASLDKFLLTKLTGKSESQREFEFVAPSFLQKENQRLRHLAQCLALILQYEGATDFYVDGFQVSLGAQSSRVVETNAKAKMLWDDILSTSGFMVALIRREAENSSPKYMEGYEEGRQYRLDRFGRDLPRY